MAQNQSTFKESLAEKAVKMGLATAQDRLLRARSRMRTVFDQHGVVLMYHRIATPSADPWDLAVSPKNFAEHLEVLKSVSRLQTFTDLSRDIRNSNDSQRKVSITFDDGYRDNLVSALPLLEKADAPATVFALSGTIGTEREFWWDTITRIFVSEQPLPNSLAINIGNREHHWSLGETERKTRGKQVPPDQWRFVPGRRLTQRQLVFTELWRVLRDASVENRERAMKQVEAWSGFSQKGSLSDHPMTHNELVKLAASPLMEIGAHTVTHPALTQLPLEQRQTEISDGCTVISDIIDKPITSFAYPFGDFDGATADIVRDLGFECACSVDQSVATRRSNPYFLPRLLVKDWNGDEFAKNLRSFAGA